MRIDNPLQRREVGSIANINEFKLKPVQNGVVIHLQLTKVKDLQEVLELVKGKVEKYQDKSVIGFDLADHPNQLLKQLKYQLSFYLEEATVSGRYIQLKNAVDSFRGVTARVYLTPDFIYVQLEEGNYYLYQAISSTFYLKLSKAMREVLADEQEMGIVN